MTRTLIWLLVALWGCGTSSARSDDDDSVAPADDDDSVEPCAPGELAPGQVWTTGGVVEGRPEGDSWSFRGLPFAEPPTGERRFAPPEPYACREGVRQALDLGPKCPQVGDAGVDGDEDCLQLNVWSADLEGDLPVLFFIHGGGNVAGSTSEGEGFPLYAGAKLASRFDVVVVTTNYRLGALGFLTHPALDDARGVSGNYGLLDQQLALRWVADNIAGFGGDPQRVLLFGESAGAVNTCSQLASPGSAGLFQAALMQSGGCNASTRSEAEAEGAGYAAELGCTDDVAACLRAADAADLVELADDPLGGGVVSGGGFGPHVDGVVLPNHPLSALVEGTHHRVPLVVGSNGDETASFTPVGFPTAGQYEQLITDYFGVFAAQVIDRYPLEDFDTPRKAWIALTTDAQFTCPARTVARAAASSQSEPVWRYFFTRRPQGVAGALNGAFHGLELPYVFQKLDEVIATTGYNAAPVDFELETALGQLWAELARSGQPSPDWPPYDPASDPFLELGDGGAVTGAGLRTDKCDFWDTLAL